jgi:hypothetical protein
VRVGRVTRPLLRTIAAARNHRQPRIFREARVLKRKFTPEENRSSIGLDLVCIHTTLAQAWVGPDRLVVICVRHLSQGCSRSLPFLRYTPSLRGVFKNQRLGGKFRQVFGFKGVGSTVFIKHRVMRATTFCLVPIRDRS